MTDARYPERWLHDRRFRTLPAEPHVTYVLSLALAVGNRSDGFIGADDLEHLRRPIEDANVLVIAGLWDVDPNGTGWQIVDFLDTQSTRSELDAADAARAKARDKKARQRSAERAAAAESVPGDRADVPGDTADVPEYYTGQARPGQARPGALTRPPTEPGPKAWDDVVVAIPGGGRR